MQPCSNGPVYQSQNKLWQDVKMLLVLHTQSKNIHKCVDYDCPQRVWSCVVCPWNAVSHHVSQGFIQNKQILESQKALSSCLVFNKFLLLNQHFGFCIFKYCFKILKIYSLVTGEMASLPFKQCVRLSCHRTIQLPAPSHKNTRYEDLYLASRHTVPMAGVPFSLLQVNEKWFRNYHIG